MTTSKVNEQVQLDIFNMLPEEQPVRKNVPIESRKVDSSISRLLPKEGDHVIIIKGIVQPVILPTGTKWQVTREA